MGEIRKVLTSLGPFSADEVKSVCADLDKSGDGEVSHKEFHAWIVGKSTHATISKAKAFLAPSDDDGLEGAFYNFCGAGHAEMDGKSLLKTLKDCSSIDKKYLTPQAVDLIFAKTKGKGRTGIDNQQFEVVLDYVADHKGKDVEEIRSAIIENRPVFKGSKAADVDKITGKLERASVTEATQKQKKQMFTPKRKSIPIGPDRVVDNSELWRTFGLGTPAGRMLKQIYVDSQTSTRGSSRPGSASKIVAKSTSLPSIQRPGTAAGITTTEMPRLNPEIRQIGPREPERRASA